MKPTEAAALLTVAAAFDNRKPDADQAHAWAAALDDLPFNDCREAVIAHYRNSREWMMPSDVRAGVKRMRRARLTEYGELPPPPRDLDPENARAYNAWLVTTTKAIADGTPPQLEPPAIDAPPPDWIRELRRKADNDEREGLTA